MLLVLALPFAGCSSDEPPPDTSPRSFAGRWDAMLVDARGNVALRGEFLIGHGRETSLKAGWLVSDSPAAARDGFTRATVIRSYKLAKNPVTGLDERREIDRRLTFDGAGWRMRPLEEGSPEGFSPPPAFFFRLQPYAITDTVQVTYGLDGFPRTHPDGSGSHGRHRHD